MKSLQKFQTLIENSTVSVYIHQNNKFVYVNPAMCLNSGYTETEFYNLAIRDFVHQDDLSIVEKKIQERLSGKTKDTRYEVRVIKKDGSYMWVDVHGTTISYNDAPAIIGTMIDITDKKENYEKLAKTEANIKTIFDTSEIFYLMLDAESKIISFNTYFQQFYKDLTGYTVEVGKDFFEFVLPERKQPLSEIIGKVIEKGERSDYEVKYTNHHHPRYYYNQFVPVTHNGSVIGVCLSGMEITEKKNIELERENVVLNLIQRNHELEQFSFIVSHNLRAPVANLLGFTGIIDENLSAEEMKLAITGIKTSSEKLDNILRDLNEILRVKKDVFQKKTVVNLETLTSEIIDDLGTAISNVDAKIEYDFSAKPFIEVDKTYLHSIFFNLISNAIKHSRINTKPELRIWSEIKNRTLVIYFKDNGIGIDLNKYGNHLFNLYYRINQEVEGKGMGLFMVKTQAELLNGKITLESEPGKGTLFMLTLPI